MNIAYFDCFAGISGDMTLAAFIDLGVSGDWLEHTIRESLKIDFELKISAVSRMGIMAKRVEVISEDPQLRNYAQISQLIENSHLPDKVKATSLKMFDMLAEAESKIHGCPKDAVHFHELGGIDAIVDIVGTSLCVDRLNFDRIIASKIPLGRGFIQCAHGTLPAPAPATLEILKNVPVFGADVSFESVTPTGASIIKTLAQDFTHLPDMRISKISYGAGSKESETLPNLLRIISGESLQSPDTVVMIETNIDDMNPEVYGFLMEKLFDDGALDVCLIPVFMKKNRPGTLLQVMCPHLRKDSLISRILSETTTLGVRYYTVERRILARQVLEIMTPFGPAAVKKVLMPDGSARIIAEYESCRDIAKRENIPIRNVYEMISKLSENQRH